MALATTINGITVVDQNIFRDERSINDVGSTPGDRFQFGLDISGGSAGYSGAGIFTPTGSNIPTLRQSLTPCGPASDNLNQCDRSSPFATAEQNGTWSLEVESPAGTTTIFPLPSAAGIPPTPVPFPSSVTITNSVNGVNPTINWTLPAGYTPDAFRVNIYDRSTPPLANGTAVSIHSVILSPTANSYTVPSILSSGQTLIPGGNVSLDLSQVQRRRRMWGEAFSICRTSRP
jgi:hypothetical protein